MLRKRPRSELSIEERGRHLSLSERIDPAHTALVVIDVQNDFCHPDGITGRQGNDLAVMEAMADRIRDILAETRRLGVLTVFVRANEDARYLHEPMAETYLRRDLNDGLVRNGTWGADWFGGVQPISAPNEIDFVKHRFSAFADTPLDLYLRSNGVRTVIFTGVVTSGCVDCSVRDGYSLGYHCVIPADGVADSAEDRHVASLRKLAQAFGTVVQTAEILEAWRGNNSISRNWEETIKRSDLPVTFADRFNPLHTALLVFGDFSNDSPESSAAAVLGRLVAGARKSHVFVLHIIPNRSPLSRSSAAIEKENRLPIDASNSIGGPVVSPAAGEEVVFSHRYGAFTATRLDSLLRANQIRSVVIAGAGLSTAIESTAREASDRDLHVLVVRDAVVENDTDESDARHSLKTIDRHFGRVAATDEVLRAWRELE